MCVCLCVWETETVLERDLDKEISDECYFILFDKNFLKNLKNISKFETVDFEKSSKRYWKIIFLNHLII